MFKTADANANANANAKNTYVRMPIINFVRACPLPAAQQALEQFQKIDPEAVKRSMTFFPTIPKDVK
jgi:SOS-response transcriptional repressor LexA